MTDVPVPKLQPHRDIKGLYIAHIDGIAVGEVCKLRDKQFLVRGAARKTLSTDCPSLRDAVMLLARQ